MRCSLHMSSSRLALTTAAVLCCALVALAPPVQARPSQRAKFRVTVTGTDRASWSYRFARRCRTGADLVGRGSETVRYATAKPVAISARSPKGGMTFDPTKTFPRLGPGPEDGARFAVNATITRQSTIAGCSDPDVQTSPDCGTKSFSVLGNLRFLGTTKLGFFTMAASLRHPFRNCPNAFGATSEDSVGVGSREAPGRLSKTTLFNRHKRSFTVAGTGSYRDPRYGAVHQTSWKATFRRIR